MLLFFLTSQSAASQSISVRASFPNTKITVLVDLIDLGIVALGVMKRRKRRAKKKRGDTVQMNSMSRIHVIWKGGSLVVTVYIYAGIQQERVTYLVNA